MSAVCNTSDTINVQCSGHGTCGNDQLCSCPIAYALADCSLHWRTWITYNAYRWTMFSISLIILIVCIWRLVLVIRGRMRAAIDSRLSTALNHVQSVTLLCITFGQMCITIRFVDPFVVQSWWPKGFQQFLNTSGQMCALGVAAGLIDFFLSIHAAFHLPSRVVRRNLHRMVAAFIVCHVILYILGVASIISLSIWNVLYGVFIAMFLIASLVGCQRYVRTILFAALREPNRLNGDQLRSLLRIQFALRTIQIVVTTCVVFSLVITTIFFYDAQTYPNEAIITDAPAWIMPWAGYLAGLVVIGNPTKIVRRKGWKPTSSGNGNGGHNTMSRQGPYMSAVHHSQQGPGSPNGGMTPAGNNMVLVGHARTPLPQTTSNGPTSARGDGMTMMGAPSVAYSHAGAATLALFGPRNTATVAPAPPLAVPMIINGNNNNSNGAVIRDYNLTTRPNSNDTIDGTPAITPPV